MSIWKYLDSSPYRELVKKSINLGHCIYCANQLEELQHRINKDKPWDGGSLTGSESHVYLCLRCGWWKIRKTNVSSYEWAFTQDVYGGVATLRNLKTYDISSPLENIRTYLVKKYEKRFEISPREWEEVIADVFRDFGYEPEITGYQKDGGIDVILFDSSGDGIGVQVKRYKSKIGVAQIRELTGALMQREITKGVFITTSSYTKFAQKASEEFAELGYPITLVNADEFFEVLKIMRIQPYNDANDFLRDFNKGKIKLHTIKANTIMKPSNP